MSDASLPVLYVDDDPGNLLVFQTLLEGEFELRVAGTAEGALAILAETDVAVVLSDRKMPHLGGEELLARVAALRPDATRVLVTAFSQTAEMREAVRDGRISEIVQKPWTPEELAATIRRGLARHRALRSRR